MIMFISKDGCWTNQVKWQQERKAAAYKKIIALTTPPREVRQAVAKQARNLKVKI